MRSKCRCILCCVLVLAIILCTFAGCGSSKKISGVPEQYIKLDVQDYIYEEEIDEHYTINVKHDYDESSGIDAVTIAICLNCEFGTDTVLGTCNYKYDKAADNWSRMGDVRWNEDTEEKIDEKAYEKKHIGSTFHLEWEIDVRDLDFANKTITCEIKVVNSTIFRSDGFETYTLSGGSDGAAFTVYAGDYALYKIQLSAYGFMVWSIR